jgi:hypothetical protein
MPLDPGGLPSPPPPLRVLPVPFDNIDPLCQNDKTTSYFCADDIGYFDPHMVRDGDMFTQGKEVWFKDVYCDSSIERNLTMEIFYRRYCICENIKLKREEKKISLAQ